MKYQRYNSSSSGFMRSLELYNILPLIYYCCIEVFAVMCVTIGIQPKNFTYLLSVAKAKAKLMKKDKFLIHIEIASQTRKCSEL